MNSLSIFQYPVYAAVFKILVDNSNCMKLEDIRSCLILSKVKFPNGRLVNKSQNLMWALQHCHYVNKIRNGKTTLWMPTQEGLNAWNCWLVEKDLIDIK